MGAFTIMNDVIKVFIGLLFSEAIKQIRIGAILGVLTCGVRIANRTACPVSIPLCQSAEYGSSRRDLARAQPFQPRALRANIFLLIVWRARRAKKIFPKTLSGPPDCFCSGAIFHKSYTHKNYLGKKCFVQK